MARSNAKINVDINAKNKTGPAFKSVQRGVENMRTRVGRAFKKMGGFVNDFRVQVVGIASAFVGFDALIRQPAEFGREMAKIATLGKDARDRIDEFTKVVRELSLESGLNTNEVADGLFNIVSAGVQAESQIMALRKGTELAVAGTSSLASAVEGLTVVSASFGETTEAGMEKVANALFASMVQARAQLSDIASNTGKVGAQFDAAGVSLEQMLVGLSLITRTTGSVEQSTTELAGALKSFTKPSESMRRVLQALNIEISDTVLEGRNFADTIVAVIKKSQELGLELTSVFSETEGFRGVLKLAKDDGRIYNQMLEDQAGLMGELATSYDTVQGTMDQLLKRFSTLVQVLSQEFSAAAFSGLDTFLKTALEDVDKLRLRAEQAGLAYRLAFEQIKPVIMNVLDLTSALFLSLKSGFIRLKSFIIDMLKPVVDVMKEVGIGESIDLRSDAQIANDQIIDQQERVLGLYEEQRKISDQINQTIRERAKFEDKGALDTIVKATQLSTPGATDLLTTNQLQDAIARQKALPNLITVGQQILDQMEDDLSDIKRLEKQAERELLELDEQIREKLLAGINNQADQDLINQLSARIIKINHELRVKVRKKLAETVGAAEPEAGADDSLDTSLENKVGLLQKLAGAGQMAFSEIKKGLGDSVKAAKSLDERFRDLGKTIFNQASNALAAFFDDIANGTAKASDAFRAFGQAVLSALNKILAEKALLELLASLGISAPTGGGSSPGVQAGANGTVFRGGIQAFAQGGVVTKPTLGLIGEGSMNEAVVPLPDGRRIPVDLRSGQKSEPIVININAVDGASVERMLSSDSGRRAIQSVIRDARSTRRDLR